MDIRHLTGRMNPIAPVQPTPKQTPNQVPLSPSGESFANILERVQQGNRTLQFSGHALKRLEDRNIFLDEQDLVRIDEAVNRAAAKGSRETLVLDGDNAFVVNIPNRTVITAVDQMELRDRVFTQIDSAVLTNKMM
jgi:flagellar operon protein